MIGLTCDLSGSSSAGNPAAAECPLVLPLVNTICPGETDLGLGVAVVTYFQPISSVKNRAVVGVEALARGINPAGGVVSPAQLFADAASRGVAAELELLCRRRSVATFARELAGTEPLLMFLNLNLSACCGGNDAQELLDTARRWSIAPSTIVVEVLESRFEDTTELAVRLREFRERGFLLALDDMGAGHSNLDRVPLIRPDVLKIDRELVRNLNADHYKQGAFKSLVYLGRRIGALVVAEGVETEADAIVALELGADLLQGFYLARPQAPAPLHLRQTETTVRAVAEQFRGHMSRLLQQQRHEQSQYHRMLDAVLRELLRSPDADVEQVLRQVLSQFPMIECLYLLDENGLQRSVTVCRNNAAFARSAVLFRPARPGTDHSLKEYYYMLRDSDLQRFTTDPYVSMASGHVCRTISACYTDPATRQPCVLCIDVACP